MIRARSNTPDPGRLVDLAWEAVMASVFLRICIDPAGLDEAAYRNMFAFVFIELLTINSTLFFFHAASLEPGRKRLLSAAVLVAFYNAIMIPVALILVERPWTLIYFWLSTCAKLVSYRRGDKTARKNASTHWWMALMLFILSALLTLFVVQYGFLFFGRTFDREYTNLLDEESPIFLAEWMFTYFCLQALGSLAAFLISFRRSD